MAAPPTATPDAVAHIPVQLVVPTGDPFVSPRLFEDLDRWAPCSAVGQIDAGHWVPRTEPETLAAGSASSWTTWKEETCRSHRAHNDERPFAGRLVLVTGAERHRPRHRAVLCRGRCAGARRRYRSAAATRTAELAELVGGLAHPLSADVSVFEAMEHLAKTVADDHGVIDVLVNNAGHRLAGDFLDTTVEDWRKVLDVNLWGVIHGCRLFGRQMVDRARGVTSSTSPPPRASNRRRACPPKHVERRRPDAQRVFRADFAGWMPAAEATLTM